MCFYVLGGDIVIWKTLCMLSGGHTWRTIKKDNGIWVRECKHCGKVQRIHLV